MIHEEINMISNEIHLRIHWKMKIEAFLFINPRSFSLEDLSSAIPEIPTSSLPNLLEELMLDYDSLNNALEIHDFGDGTYSFQVRNSIIHEKGVIRFTKGKELKKSEIETLAFIAYNQPIELNDIIDIYGKTVKKKLKLLEIKQFIKKKKETYNILNELGEEIKITVEVYLTTQKFADYFEVKNDIEQIRNKIQEIMDNS
jgi:chromosome segregation and condensation protein ScpB